ncbi:MAG: cytochrome b/b6 domain-containing protein [Dehalococcoidia bacterium]|nr:cytochrome b/b6 domain-containing protein [Dehalococcoidia bacterium]
MTPTSRANVTPSSASDRLHRFTLTERTLHWAHAVVFLLLVITGAAILFPVFATSIADRELVRAVHITAGFGLVLTPIAIALAGNRRAVRRDLADVDRWEEDDWLWIRGWSYYRHGRRMPPPQGRFNAGQKVNAVFTGATVLFFFVTGVIMWKWFYFPRWLVENAGGLHDVMTALAVAVWIGHMYMALLNPTTRESIRGMTVGWVKRDWAAEHHEKWVDELDRQAPPPPGQPDPH